MENFPIQGYDLLMVVILVLATVFGAWKGMAWQIASLASLVVSSIVAMQFSGQVAPYISSHEPWNRFIAMLILFAATSATVWVAFRLVAGLIDRVKLKEFDRQMGALFGLAKGALFCLVITFFAVTLSEGFRQKVLRSHSGKFTARFLQRATPAMPQEVRDVLGKYIDEFERKLDPNTPAEKLLEDAVELSRDAAETLGDLEAKAAETLDRLEPIE
ncbi:MAG: CvpA family protein [Planctomycetota bacterium]